MKNRFFYLLPGILQLLLLSCTEPAEISTLENLIPKPWTVSTDTGSFVITAASGIYISNSNPELNKMGTGLAAMLRTATGYDIPVVENNSLPSKGNILITLSDTDTSMGKEGYDLSITSSLVTIKAFQPAGLFYGIQTLRQLLPASFETNSFQKTALVIPACTIKDHPLYSYRGSMLDVARHFFQVADVKRYIDLLAYYKMNILHLHLSDDQGWRIEIKSWPALTTRGGSTEVGGGKGGFYTQEQYKEIVQYARDRYITIIPEIDMPGHTNAALASYATLNCNDTATALYTGIEVGFSSLCTHKDITYTFVDDVVRELSEITPGPWIHIGGDESHVTSKEDYIPFVEKVTAIVKAHGKQAIGWDEIAISSLPENTVAQFWDNAANTKRAVNQGAKIIMSPAKKAYLDMQYDSTSTPGLHWAGYIEVDTAYTWDPATYIPGISKENILGIEAPLWTETIKNMDDIEYMVFPRLPGYAEIGWSNPKNRNWEEYKVRLGNNARRFKAMNINFYPSRLVPWNY